ncbi:hypothetical protein ACKKBF_B05610 [Auxenochlorella protothecoides x Auxenochlorella symbiontica]
MAAACRTLARGWALTGLVSRIGARGLATDIYEHTPGPAAFAFDIDGVLMRGGQVLPAAKRALALLHDASGFPRYPIVFLTNSGGWLEEERARRLSAQLGVRVGAAQVVQSHTPLKALAPSLADHRMLLVGRGDLHSLAAGYGLRRCVTVEELVRADPASVPFAEVAVGGESPSAAAAAAARPTPSPGPSAGDGSAQPIRAVLVLNDPSDWYCALQTSLDVVLGRAVPGARPATRPPPGAGTCNPNPVHVVFSNPDVEWAGAHAAPRLGGGAFAACLQALHTEVTGAPLPHVTRFGKPHAPPYDLAAASLHAQAAALGWGDRAFGAIWAVGDNPEADVAGANAAGPPWTSVLVRTGVFRGPGNSERHPARLVVEDVEAAVRAALHRARSATWHSMR